MIELYQGNHKKLMLGLNEVTLHDAMVGLFDPSIEPIKYLAMDKYKELTEALDIASGDGVFEFVVTLSKFKKVEGRKAYSLIDLLSDFGGFNYVIYQFLSLPMGIYSAALFNQHVSSQSMKRKNNL